jgi:hypothetical protein
METLTPEQLEILTGLLQPFEASLTDDEVWCIETMDGERAYGDTFVIALLTLADQQGLNREGRR